MAYVWGLDVQMVDRSELCNIWTCEETAYVKLWKFPARSSMYQARWVALCPKHSGLIRGYE